MLTMREKYVTLAANLMEIILREIVPLSKRKVNWNTTPKIQIFDARVSILFLFHHGIELTVKGS
jgi:hypothetical protein